MAAPARNWSPAANLWRSAQLMREESRERPVARPALLWPGVSTRDYRSRYTWVCTFSSADACARTTPSCTPSVPPRQNWVCRGAWQDPGWGPACSEVGGAAASLTHTRLPRLTTGLKINTRACSLTDAWISPMHIPMQEPLQVYWFRAAGRICNSMVHSNSNTLHSVLKADMCLCNNGCDRCWLRQFRYRGRLVMCEWVLGVFIESQKAELIQAGFLCAGPS